MPNKTQTTVRFDDPDKREMVKDAADNAGVSMNVWIVRAIDEKLERDGDRK